MVLCAEEGETAFIDQRAVAAGKNMHPFAGYWLVLPISSIASILPDWAMQCPALPLHWTLRSTQSSFLPSALFQAPEVHLKLCPRLVLWVPHSLSQFFSRIRFLRFPKTSSFPPVVMFLLVSYHMGHPSISYCTYVFPDNSCIHTPRKHFAIWFWSRELCRKTLQKDLFVRICLAIAHPCTRNVLYNLSHSALMLDYLTPNAQCRTSSLLESEVCTRDMDGC